MPKARKINRINLLMSRSLGSEEGLTDIQQSAN
jgi:hypothetical protein